MKTDKSYIATLRRKSHKENIRRVHYSARNISDAALIAESAADNLWEVVKVEVLE